MVSTFYKASNFLRVSYQACEEALLLYQAPIAGTLAEKLFRCNRITVAALDAFAFYAVYVNPSVNPMSDTRTLYAGIIGHRIIGVCQGIYLLRQPHADRNELLKNIFLNIFQIQIFALSILQEKLDHKYPILRFVSLAYRLADSALRIHSLFSHRTAIRNQIVRFYQAIPFTAIFGGLDELSRRALSVLAICKSLFFARHILHSHFERELFELLVPIIPISCVLTILIELTLEEVVVESNILTNTRMDRVLNLAQLSISALGGSALGIATAIGLGLVNNQESVSTIFYRAKTPALIGALTLTLIGMIKIFSRKVFDSFNIPDNQMSHIASWCFTVISATYLSCNAAVGFRLSSSKFEALHTIANITVIGLSTIAFGFAIRKFQNLVSIGPMTWDEIQQDFSTRF